ncbi:MAG: homocysteine S-methyltransferase family protein [Proteobacteria bacterium]|nr:homocysteine S-methyltransferase family protein [Pseudomonadota bacterium]
MAPEDYAGEACRWVEAGVQIVGGCCGTGPEHIRALKERLPRSVPARPSG